MKSYIAKPADVQRKWYIVDAEGKTLGRLATEIATVLRGKHKVTFTPHVDGGDFVVVVNAEKVVLTGKKLDQKMYRYHTGYVGGLKEITYREMMEKKPEEVVAHAVSGMLPKNGTKSCKRIIAIKIANVVLCLICWCRVFAIFLLLNKFE